MFLKYRKKQNKFSFIFLKIIFCQNQELTAFEENLSFTAITSYLWLLICGKNVFLYSMKIYLYAIENI